MKNVEIKNVTRIFTQLLLAAAITPLLAVHAVNAQTGSTPPASQNSATHQVTDLVAAANQYKASSKEVLTLQEAGVTKVAAKLEELRGLVSEGLVARKEFENTEQELATLRAQLQATQKQVADCDKMIAEIKTTQELAKTQAAKSLKLVSKQYGALTTTATMLRDNGPTAWSLGGLDGVRAFFSTKFGRALPTSAVGQSATHNRLGYDHHNAVDVALHPDSFEGQALITYLEDRGIPFLAFRSAVPGVATGPHIHIGNPSHRLS